MIDALAVDPGLTTGLALLKDGKVSTYALPIDEVMPFFKAMPIVDIVVVELFATAGMISRPGLKTVDLIGQIKGWCLAKELSCIVYTPQSRTAWKEAAKNYPGKGRVIHENDALAHLLHYLEANSLPIT